MPLPAIPPNPFSIRLPHVPPQLLHFQDFDLQTPSNQELTPTATRQTHCNQDFTPKVRGGTPSAAEGTYRVHPRSKQVHPPIPPDFPHFPTRKFLLTLETSIGYKIALCTFQSTKLPDFSGRWPGNRAFCPLARVISSRLSASFRLQPRPAPPRSGNW
jgi:hypothetical protein